MARVLLGRLETDQLMKHGKKNNSKAIIHIQIMACSDHVVCSSMYVIGPLT